MPQIFYGHRAEKLKTRIIIGANSFDSTSTTLVLVLILVKPRPAIDSHMFRMFLDQNWHANAEINGAIWYIVVFEIGMLWLAVFVGALLMFVFV